MLRPTASLRIFAACFLLLGSSLAHAQYAWIDEKGVRHFSDRPPPPSTPPHKILKVPGRALPAAAAAPAPQEALSATPPAAATATKAPPTLAEREADFRERARKREEQEQKEMANAQRRRDLAEHCRAAREHRAQIESGIRIAKFDAKGERSFVTDEERAVQLARANKALAQCP